MAIKLNLAQLPEENIGFGYSIIRELLLSLNVLSNHKNHPLHISWALSTRQKISAELRSELRTLRPVIATAARFLVASEQVEEPAFEREISALESMHSEHFAEVLVNDCLINAPPNGQRPLKQLVSLTEFRESDSIQQKVSGYLKMWYGDDDTLLPLLAYEPEQLQQRFLQLLRRYWSTFFEYEWQGIESIILEEIRVRGHELQRSGSVPMLAGLSERFSVDIAQQIATYFKPNVIEECTFRQIDNLNLYPSYYTYPSLIFFIKNRSPAEPLTLSITYPMPQHRLAGKPPVPSDQLLNILRGVADPTRLQILELVAQKPCSTMELARIIGLSESAISKQLKLMQRVGWIGAERDSYYVLYRASSEPLQHLTNALSLILNSASAT
ncbi:MAG: metalloregulator ArsR/SmtB family transcription factor [Ardenticatenaceae bacterium]|nr:metalloregulator ArsR/SmtB family transcription factor [Ardenticatenaceae bacterium]